MPKEKKKVLFSNAFFGFDKQDVMDYLKDADDTAMEKIDERDARIDALNSEIMRLNARISNYERQQESLNAERELISQTLMSAKDAANKILNDARNQATKERAELQQTYTLEINKLATIRNEIIQLRKFATDAIRTFEKELTSLERSTIE